jgi:hypothetical protein
MKTISIIGIIVLVCLAYSMNLIQPSASAQVAVANVNGGEVEAIAVRNISPAFHYTQAGMLLAALLLFINVIRTTITNKKTP